MRGQQKQTGFTLVELLIVIVVIAILAAITVVAYGNISSRARDSAIASNIEQLDHAIEAYNATNGHYPITTATAISTTMSAGAGQSAAAAFTDANCPIGTKQSDWIPDLTMTLPQSTSANTGVGGYGGCYMYTSDGTLFILSAWNMLSSPQSTLMYHRLGYREMTNVPFYYCNQPNIGGNNPTPYTLTKDYYKYSYTVTNITGCNETPPTGA